MTTQTLTAASFEQTLLDNDIVLVDFWAAWCGPCRTFGPIFEKASATHPDIVFGKVDPDGLPRGHSCLQPARSAPVFSPGTGHRERSSPRHG
jgi:thiol-disulfide isomerase/thioredoxin